MSKNPPPEEVINTDIQTDIKTPTKPVIDYTKLIISLSLSAMVLAASIAWADTLESALTKGMKNISPLKVKFIKATILTLIVIVAILIFVRFVK